MSLKKGICLALAAMLILALFTGCKKDDPSSSTESTTSQSSENGGDSSGESGGDPSGEGGSSPASAVSIEANVPRSDDEVKALIEEFSSGERFEELQGGFTVEKIEGQGTSEIPTYNLKDNNGNFIGGVGVIGNKPVELDTGEDPAPVDDVVETTDENGNPVIFYSYVTATTPPRYEVGIGQNQSSYHSVYIGVNTDFSPKLKKASDGKVFITITDGGQEMDICELRVEHELGYYFVHLEYTEAIADDESLIEKYFILSGGVE